MHLKSNSKANNLQGSLPVPHNNLLDLNSDSPDQPAKKTGFAFIKKAQEPEIEESNILQSAVLIHNNTQTKPAATTKKFDPFSLSQKNPKAVPQAQALVEETKNEEKSEKSSFQFLNKNKNSTPNPAPNFPASNNMGDLLSLDINYAPAHSNGVDQHIETKNQTEKGNNMPFNQNMNQNANILSANMSKAPNQINQNNNNFSNNLNLGHQPINLPYQQAFSFPQMNSMNYPQNFQNMQNYQNLNNMQNFGLQNMQHFQSLQNMAYLQNKPQFQNLYNNYPPQINLNPQMTNFYFAQIGEQAIGGGEEIKKEVEKKKVLDESAFDFVKLS